MELFERMLKWPREDVEEAYNAWGMLAPVLRRNGEWAPAFLARKCSTQAAIALNLIDARIASARAAQLKLVDMAHDDPVDRQGYREG